MKPLVVAIQGIEASFHDMAARRFFGGRAVETCNCQTFTQLCKALIEEKADVAIMAIENSLVGSILPNKSLLREYPLHIVGETYLHIEQNLMALPGQRLENIRSVRSHPMALHQCSDFLEDHPYMRGIETFDTAESARDVRDRQMTATAAIASRQAAEEYGLEILKYGIENLKENYTRFLILDRQALVTDKANKASVNFSVRHEVGALADALSLFRDYSINLSQIQSIPIPGSPYEYGFHVDLEFQSRGNFDLVMTRIGQTCPTSKILGIYEKGEKPYDYTSSQSA